MEPVKPMVLVAVGGLEASPLPALLRDLGCQVVEAAHPDALAASAHDRRVRLIVVADSVARPGDGLQMVLRLRDDGLQVPIVVVAREGSEAGATAALRAGASDYLTPRATITELAALARGWLWGPLRARPTSERMTHAARPMIGESAAMQRVRATMARIAPLDCNVLVTGETGVGKELVAELIHAQSPRRGRPLVCINCAAIPDSLFESELFGFERGAFTGAHAPYEGKLKLADGGMVFLDEIGDMSLSAQAKMLRVIETKEVYRIGGRRSVPLDVRVIVATNQPLEQLVSQARFRPDLYFRLNVARIDVPPLRDRREDIPLLVEHCIRRLGQQLHVETEGLTEEALECLLRYDWPGNVRELCNVLEAVLIARPPPRIPAALLPEAIRQGGGALASGAAAELNGLLLALNATDWNKSKAAQRLRWSRMKLYRKMAKFRLTTPASTARVPGRASPATGDVAPGGAHGSVVTR